MDAQGGSQKTRAATDQAAARSGSPIGKSTCPQRRECLFEAGEQDDDNGLRVTLHLKGVDEYVVCTERDGGFIEVFDLTVSPPTLISLQDVAPLDLRIQLEQMVQ
jgi:hypothetical protein